MCACVSCACVCFVRARSRVCVHECVRACACVCVSCACVRACVSCRVVRVFNMCERVCVSLGVVWCVGARVCTFAPAVSAVVSLIMLISYVFVAACSVYLYWCASDWRVRSGVCECVIRAGTVCQH